MMRSRTLKPGFFKNEDLASLTPLARILFEGLWCLADRTGVLEYRPTRIKAEILPYDKCDVESLLELLVKKGFIACYQAGGRRFIYIPTFPQHQRPHPHEPSGQFPPPPACNGTGNFMSLHEMAICAGSSGSSGSSLATPDKPGVAAVKVENPSDSPSPFPEVLNGVEFNRAWGEWLRYRRGRRLSTRPETLQKQLALLASFGPVVALATLEASIRNGWQGIFPEKIAKSMGVKAQPAQPPPSKEDLLRETERQRREEEAQRAAADGGGLPF